MINQFSNIKKCSVDNAIITNGSNKASGIGTGGIVGARNNIGKVNITTHQMQIYNNPILNINKLSNSTYNSLVKLIYDNTHRSMKKTGKKLNYV